MAAKISRRDVAAAKLFRERHDADRQRRPGHDMVGQPRRRAGRARRSSAISDEPPPMSKSTTPSVVALDQRAAAGHRKPRLGVAGR